MRERLRGVHAVAVSRLSAYSAPRSSILDLGPEQRDLSPPERQLVARLLHEPRKHLRIVCVVAGLRRLVACVDLGARARLSTHDLWTNKTMELLQAQAALGASAPPLYLELACECTANAPAGFPGARLAPPSSRRHRCKQSLLRASITPHPHAPSPPAPIVLVSSVAPCGGLAPGRGIGKPGAERWRLCVGDVA